MNRIEILKGFLEQDPKDSFSRYALALEYIKSGQTEDARREFEFVRDQRSRLRCDLFPACPALPDSWVTP